MYYSFGIFSYFLTDSLAEVYLHHSCGQFGFRSLELILIVPHDYPNKIASIAKYWRIFGPSRPPLSSFRRSMIKEASRPKHENKPLIWDRDSVIATRQSDRGLLNRTSSCGLCNNHQRRELERIVSREYTLQSTTTVHGYHLLLRYRFLTQLN